MLCVLTEEPGTKGVEGTDLGIGGTFINCDGTLTHFVGSFFRKGYRKNAPGVYVFFLYKISNFSSNYAGFSGTGTR